MKTNKVRLIDADALVVKLKDWRGDKEDVDMSDPHYVGYYAAMDRAIKMTCLAHTIDAAPVVHSYWDEYENTIVCKACGEKWSIREDGDFVIIEAKGDLKFCPSCGARMDGEPE